MLFSKEGRGKKESRKLSIVIKMIYCIVVTEVNIFHSKIWSPNTQARLVNSEWWGSGAFQRSSRGFYSHLAARGGGVCSRPGAGMFAASLYRPECPAALTLLSICRGDIFMFLNIPLLFPISCCYFFF